MNVENVVVIVSRWFGGIKLGPERFKLICNSARHLLEEQGYGLQSSTNQNKNGNNKTNNGKQHGKKR